MAAHMVTLGVFVSLLAGGYYLKKSGRLHKMLFYIAYNLYARTSLGYYYHQRMIKKRKSNKPHSIVEPFTVDESVVIYPVPYLSDNYCYLIVNQETRRGVAVDPAHHKVLLDALKHYNVTLVGALVTHKHWDHSGGNHELRTMFPHMPIYGGRRDSPSCANHLLNGGEDIHIEGMTFKVIHTPGHTTGHVVYVLNSTTPPCLFSGDHLFVAGCGKIFEGSVSEMYQSLSLVKNLSPNTLVFPGHEYSWSNLQFALSLDPDNANVQEKLEAVRQLRLKCHSTVPTQLKEELCYNPFLNTDSSVIKHRLQLTGPDVTQVDVLRKLRSEKDKFKPLHTTS